MACGLWLFLNLYSGRLFDAQISDCIVGVRTPTLPVGFDIVRSRDEAPYIWALSRVVDISEWIELHVGYSRAIVAVMEKFLFILFFACGLDSFLRRVVPYGEYPRTIVLSLL